MFKKIYIHNYKCFQNFEFKLDNEKSLLLLGKNGVGKSSLLNILNILKNIANNENRLGALFDKKDFKNPESPIELDFTLDIQDVEYQYKLSVIYPEKFHEPKIQTEELFVDDKIIYRRDEEGSVSLDGKEFIIDWHSVALPVLFPYRTFNKDKIDFFKKWLSNMIFLAPIPSQISSNTYSDGRWLEKDASNFCSWLNDILNTEPSFYADLVGVIKKIFPDFNKIKFDDYGIFKQLEVSFIKEQDKIELDFEHLSDGEKLLFIFSTIITLFGYDNKPFFCFWDEPENYISIALLENLIQYFRAKVEFNSNGQLFFTSHNAEIMNIFPKSNIYYMYRESHLSPSRIVNLQEESDNVVDLLKYNGNLS